jgi:hypothetical protein|tara:strand:- start:105 stop:407 length:303 start_codon:yes stop_codon:yes gene_type:complete
MERPIKIALSVLLFLCLLNMPYGYYQLVRFVSFGVFAYIGFKEFENSNQTMGLVYFGLAILFQPFLKIALGREVWNIVDVIVAIGLIATLFRKEVKSNEE